MKRFESVVAVTVLVVGTSLACALPVGAQDCPNPPWAGVGSSPDAHAQALVASMTLDQKIQQVHGEILPEDFRNVPGVAELCIPPLFVTNGPAGVGPGPQVLNNVPATALPAPLALAATWDPRMARHYGNVQGAEMRDIGRNLLEAPDVDIARTALNGRTFEAYGEDPYLVSRMGVANIRAIQSHGILAMAKHFVVNNQEAQRFTIDVQVDDRTLREIYLPPFEAAVREAGVASIMCAYNSVNGAHSCENDVVLNQIFKGDWGFDGFVQSDFFATGSTIPMANAGMDLEMPNGARFGDALRDAVIAGDVAEARVDDMLVRRYRQMFRFGLFDRRERISPIPEKKHAKLARASGVAGTVLLRNENDTLPLDAAGLDTVVVVGPWSTIAATGGGKSSKVNPLRVITPLEGITARLGAGVTISADDGTDAAAVAAAATGADVAIVVVGRFDTEQIDRPDLSLPDGQDALVAAVAAVNPRTVVVVHAGGPILMPWRDDVEAIVEGWYPGGEDGAITAAILFGDETPSGKLPITFPAADLEWPANTPERYPGVGGQVFYDEGLLVGYRWYDATATEPLYPFGFGLSYTKFELGDLRVRERNRRVTVKVRVTNSGRRTGSEVVQAYIVYPPALGEPPKQLRAFRKIRVRAGRTRTARLRLEPEAFRLRDAAAGRWRTEAGDYGILVGTSSADTPLSATIGL